MALLYWHSGIVFSKELYLRIDFELKESHRTLIHILREFARSGLFRIVALSLCQLNQCLQLLACAERNESGIFL